MTTTETASRVNSAVAAAIEDRPLENVSLASRAMLTSLTIRMWAATKHDKRVSHEVAVQHNAANDAGRYVKRLAGSKDKNNSAKAALDAIKQVATEARTYHYFVTRAWLDNGSRILSVDAYGEYTARMAQFEDKFYAAVDAFEPLYPTLVSEAQAELGTMWNPADYPRSSEIRSYYALGVNTFPMPAAQDFRADIGDIEVQRVRRQLTSVIEEAMAESTKEVYARIFKAVGHMAERLRVYKVTAEGVENKFHDSLVNNVRELAGILPMLNVTNDAVLASITSDITESLTHWDADVLRGSESRRNEVAAEAERILAHVSEFLA